ncbi:DEAD/DEAH box helicase [Candidatus Berkiella cookevillensis]|uniref:DEAD-box ATP-dependent RNA helicase RhpA n=1 Tax=Candidatus Berkiella cookevillensis TaxID=437022 RepID=A0A0Q9YNI1_9GAMM|nr:DEAD/DEAH box helicase [Candidatus Berkiella cookevillensis]
MTFKSLGLIEAILLAVEEKGYQTPSPIQAQTIPAILQGKDVMASAQTGTGKTAGFVLPILQKLSKLPPVKPRYIRTLILAPTRELAAQIEESTFAYGKNLKLKSAAVFGGVKINPQIQALERGVDILIATPGRLMDLYEQNAVKFNELSVLVLDEADRMLDMGFIKDIRRVLSLLPKNRQNLLFSATFSNDIFALAKGLLHNPIEINVAPRNTTAKGISQVVYPVDKMRKAELLSHLIQTKQWYQALIFCRTKHGANKLVKSLHLDGIEALAIHGNKSQAQRTKALAEFKQGKIQILVATDIAARGLDIDQLPFVVNFDLPNIPEDYVHRIGRTGRAGAEGQAISLVSADEIKQLLDIERLIKAKIQRQEIDSFEPRHNLPSPAEKSHHHTKPVRRTGGNAQRPQERRSHSSSTERTGSGNRGRSSEQPSSAPFRARQEDNRAKPARSFERRAESGFKPREEKPTRGRNFEQGSGAPFRARQEDNRARPARNFERRAESGFKAREEKPTRGRSFEQGSGAPFRARQEDNRARPARNFERRAETGFKSREEKAGQGRGFEQGSRAPFKKRNTENPNERTRESSRQRKKLAREEYGHEE